MHIMEDFSSMHYIISMNIYKIFVFKKNFKKLNIQFSNALSINILIKRTNKLN